MRACVRLRSCLVGACIKMAPTLEQASAAAHRQDWYAILGLKFPASEREVLKAKRQLQRTAHQDRGGSAELSQLINLAADELIDLLRPEIRERRERQDHEDEMRRLEEEELRRREDAADGRKTWRGEKKEGGNSRSNAERNARIASGRPCA